MTSSVVPVALAFALSASAAGSEGSTMSRIFPYPTHLARLDNGLQVVLIPMSSGGLVGYWTIVRTGSRDEYEPGHTGFAHFFEHMMFRGTERFPQDVYSGIVTRIGADANAFTSDDLTAYHLSIASADLETVMEIESDRFQNLSYTEQAFQTEAGAVYGEYRKNRMSPFFVVYEALHQAAFERHTYGHTAMGYEQDIKAMPTMLEYSRSFFGRYYRPENCILLIAGDIAIERTLNLVRSHYAGWKPGYLAPEIPPEPVQAAERRIDVAYDGRSLPIIWVAYKADAFDPEDRSWVAAFLLSELAFGETSPIHNKLVLDEQVVEFVSASLELQRDPGLFEVVARVKDPAKVDYVLGELDRTIELQQQRPPEAGRLSDLKSRLKYSFLMNLDTADHVASSLARILAVTGRVDAVDRLYRTFDSITPEDVQAAASRYLVARHRTTAVLRGKS